MLLLQLCSSCGMYLFVFSVLAVAQVEGFGFGGPAFSSSISTTTSRPSARQGTGPAGYTCRATSRLPMKDREGEGAEEELREFLRKQSGDLSDTKATGNGAEGGYSKYSDELMNKIRAERSYVSVIAEKTLESLESAWDSLFDSKPDADEIMRRQLLSGGKRKKLVVLGTGWGSHSFIKEVDAAQYDVTIISPRNYFLFTPLLTQSAVGTVEYRSITEPIRNVNPQVKYVEATCNHINPVYKKVTCQNVVCEGTSCAIQDFTVEYDYLVVGVGASTNTFGIKGVKEHCIFLKQISDASRLRTAIGNCFERANIPSATLEERQAALTFCVIGAGPTGIEFTAELRDFLEEDAARFYPQLLRYVRIKLIEASDRVLMAFDESLQQVALKSLTERKTTLIARGLVQEEPTEVLLKAGVKEVTDSVVKLANGEEIPYGFAVWAAGNGALPLVSELIENLPSQRKNKAWGRGRLIVDDWLRVKGAIGDGIFSIGDCAVVDQKPLPQTAQVASQQGVFLGRLFSRDYDLLQPVPIKQEGKKVNSVMSEKAGLSATGRFARAFQFLNLGILAYVGNAGALAQVQVGDKQIKSSGQAGFVLWRSIYLSKQVSMRNRVLVVLDWSRTKLFGRDITRL